MKRFGKAFTVLAAFCLLVVMVVMVFSNKELYVAASTTVRLGSGGNIRTLDPALADDLSSRNILGAFYETLVAYDYSKAGVFRLHPLLLAEMPDISADGLTWRFKLKPGRFFPSDPAFADQSERLLTSSDVKFSFLRLLDPRNHSPVSWILRGKFAGEENFVAKCASVGEGDWSPYEEDFAGIKIIDELNFELHFQEYSEQFIWLLAMPNLGVVSEKMVKFRQNKIADAPAGSGPFKLIDWRRDYQLVLEADPEYVSAPGLPAARVGKIVIPVIKQPMTGWLLFLQGELDNFIVDKDLEGVVSGGELAPALLERGMRLAGETDFEIRYIGFNFRDPILSDNLALRKAISHAYNPERWHEHFGGQLILLSGVLPPGVDGYRGDFVDPLRSYNLELAATYLAEAGYPGGIDPATGEALTLTLDLAGNTVGHRQSGELLASQLAKIGIRLVVNLNNRPRFVEKLRQGQTQLFRYSWAGDYPDAENFLQLFYSGNLGTCNRTGFCDPEFDRRYEKALKITNLEARAAEYAQLNRYLTEKIPWITEGMPLSYQILQPWLDNYIIHDFPFDRWRYLQVNDEMRRTVTAEWKPLKMEELRK